MNRWTNALLGVGGISTEKMHRHFHKVLRSHTVTIAHPVSTTVPDHILITEHKHVPHSLGTVHHSNTLCSTGGHGNCHARQLHLLSQNLCLALLQ